MARKNKRPQRPTKRKSSPEKFAPAVVAFFEQAGVPIGSAGGWITIRGRKALRPPATRASNVRWGPIIDRVALGHCADLMIDALRRHGSLLGTETKAYFIRTRGVFELRRGERRLALVRPTRADVEGQPRIQGNFLINGEHWGKLAKAIERYERGERTTKQPKSARAEKPEQVEMPEPLEPPKPLLVLTSPPAGLNDEVVEACRKASASIRRERSIAYDHPVVLETAQGTLKFLPISGPEHALRVHFEFDLEGGVVKGRLDLFGNDDPRVDPDTPESLLPRAWASAMLGFAAISCFTLPPRQPRTDGSRRGSGLWRSSSRGKFRQPSSLSRRRFWPSHLEPVGIAIAPATKRPGCACMAARRRSGARRSSGSGESRSQRPTTSPEHRWLSSIRASELEHQAYERLRDSVIDAVGVQPVAMTGDRAHSIKEVFELNTRVGIASVIPWRKWRAGMEREDVRCDAFDEHGVPRCRYCGGPVTS